VAESSQTIEPASEYHAGIDFANRETRTGRCFLRDDGAALTVSFEQPAAGQVRTTGVDCPFGTSAEFYWLLTGTVPEVPPDGSFESRATERWVRRVIGGEYRTRALWDATARRQYQRNSYFHPTTHVQPAVGLRIVPAFLYWLSQRHDLPGDLPEKLRVARRGDGPVVEAHPRLFLYSMVERVHRARPGVVTTAVLAQVAGYKDKNGESPRGRRVAVYEFLRANPDWTGANRRRLEPAAPEATLFDTDHAFDAWLSALTAWATDRGETIRWRDAREPGMDENRVGIEGHILILDHTR
jgi:hypothetical protein